MMLPVWTQRRDAFLEGQGFEPREAALGGRPVPLSASAERREGARHIAVMRIAKLHSARGEELCLVRNISTGGLMAHIWSGLVMGDRVAAEFKSGQIVEGRIVWRRENRIGVQFDAEIDVPVVLGGDEDPAPGFQPRAPRVTVGIKGRLRCGALYYAVDVNNISQGGVQIACPDPSLDERIERGSVVLTIAGLPPLQGNARWHGKGLAGIAFNNAMPLETLAKWIVEQQG